MHNLNLDIDSCLEICGVKKFNYLPKKYRVIIMKLATKSKHDKPVLICVNNEYYEFDYMGERFRISTAKSLPAAVKEVYRLVNLSIETHKAFMKEYYIPDWT